MQRTRKPFTVVTKKSRRSGSVSEKQLTTDEVKTGPKPRALKKQTSEVAQPEETARDKALREKVEAAAKDGRILATRSQKAEPTPELDESEPDALEVRQPSRRYRKKEPVRSIDPAEYQPFTADPELIAEVEAPEPQAIVDPVFDPEQPIEDDPQFGYRVRRRWRTGNVPLNERWKVRSGLERNVSRRRDRRSESRS